MNDARRGLRRDQAALKRTFDLALALVVLITTFWLIAAAWLAARIDTRASGFFVQERIGRHGKPFRLIKIRTMRADGSPGSSVTVLGDPRITTVGVFLRRWKLDELPQVLNVLRGDMSIVGPRPDVAGLADKLDGLDRIVLSVRPGITGPATLKYRDEEIVLSRVADPDRHSREVIFPDKTRINRAYVENWSFGNDLRCIWRTILPEARCSKENSIRPRNETIGTSETPCSDTPHLS